MFQNWFQSKRSEEVTPFDCYKSRETMMERIWHHINEAKEAFDAGKTRRADKHHEEKRKLEKQYLGRLPVRELSRCPFCNETYRQRIDPYGYDGAWWHRMNDENRLRCPHHQVVRCATNIHGQYLARPSNRTAEFGPAVPYVIPRLLNLPGMVAVLTAMKLEAGYDFYTIHYYCSGDVDENLLVLDWVGNQHGFEVRNDYWDFDLKPWVNAGKLRWCSVGPDHAVELESPDTTRFPYSDLVGERGLQTSQGDQFFTQPVPRPGRTEWTPDD